MKKLFSSILLYKKILRRYFYRTNLKTKNEIKIFILFLALQFFPLLSFSYWPIFKAPDKNFLLNQQLIETASCPPQEGRLVNAAINIKSSLCKTYCPESWQWVSDDHDCHSLATQFELRRFDISHYYDADGTTLYSVITAWYGDEESIHTKPLKLTFITPQEHWYCFELNEKEHEITCANDI